MTMNTIKVFSMFLVVVRDPRERKYKVEYNKINKSVEYTIFTALFHYEAITKTFRNNIGLNNLAVKFV